MSFKALLEEKYENLKAQKYGIYISFSWRFFKFVYP